MKKTTFFNSDENRIEKAKRWLRLLSISTAFFVGQSVFAQDSGTIQIGAGTATASGSQAMPVSNYNFNYSQQIITAAEYASGGGAAGEITKLRYKITTVGTFTVWNNWRVFIGNTTKTAFTSKTDWIPMSELEEVFNGNIVSVAPTAGDWIEITFTAPFDYTGGNIVVAIDENTPGWTTSPAWASYTSTAGAGLLYRSDDVNHDPTVSNPPDPATTTSDFSDEAYVLALVPQIQFEGTLADCVAPLGLVVGNVTAFTADVSWDASGSSSAEGYEYVLSTSNTPPTGAGTATVDGNTYVQLENLTPQTTYYLFVRTNCGSGSFSEWSVPRSFTTGCVAVTTFPFVETFNADSTSKQCWTVINGNADVDSDAWNLNGTTIPRSGQSAELYTDYNTSNNDYLITQLLDLGATPKRMKFWVRHYSNGEPDNLNVRVSTTGKNISDFTDIVLTLSTTQITATYTEYAVDLSDYVDSEIYIAFAREDAPADGWYIAIDDVTVEDLPLCPDQTGLVVSGITSDGASTSWDDMSASGAIGYEYAVTTSATPPTSGTLIEDTFYSASGLASNTVHYLHVRTSCGAGNFGIWVTKSFRTACTAFTEFSENFDSVATPGLPSCWGKILSGATLSTFATVGTSTTNASAPNGVDLYNSSTGAADNIILVTPTLSNLSEGTHRLKFKARNTTASQDLQIGVLTDVADASTFTLVQDVDITTTFQDYVVNFDGYTGPGVAIGIRRLSTSTYTNVYLDDIVWEAMPTCPDQTGLVVGSITSDGAATSWDDMSANGVTSYEYAVTTSATPPASGTDTTDPFYLATGLDANTAYYLHVRPSCGAGNFGIWVTKAFRTTCTAFTVPYFEGFETGYTHNAVVDGCWTQQSVTGTQVWRANNTFTDYNRSPRTGAWNAFLQWSNEDWMFIPVQLEGGVEYELKFYARQDGAGATNSSVKASYGTSNSIADMTNIIVPSTGIVNGSYQLISGLLTPSTTGVYYIGINGYMNSTPWYISIDDISLDLAPTCPNVTGLVVGSVTYNSASVSWDDMEVDGYEYAVTTSSTPPTSGENITDTFDSVSGLASNTLHYLHVRSVCGGDFGSWMTISFTTLVAPSAVPWTEGFALVAVPTGWTGSGYTIDLASASIGSPSAAKFGDGQTSIIRRNPWSSATTGNFATNTVGLVEAGHILSFDYKLINYGNGNQPAVGSGKYIVEVSTDFGATYTQIDEVVNDGVAGWQTKIYPLDAYEGEYVKVKITDTWTSGDYFIGFDNFYIGAELSSPQFDKSALKVYPNPTKNILYVNYNQEISNVEVYNLVGQRVVTISPNANEGQIDMSNLASGAYFVKVTSNNATRTVKVIKE